MSDNKRIAKNTLFLYFRMILVMGVSLYSSRVVLDKLGVDDFGLYNVVGGVAGMLFFLNGTLSIGTLRYLTFELGRKDKGRLIETFNTAFYTHLGLALIIALLLETGGLWFVYNKLVIPEERLHAAVIVYHISILTSIIAITQVPYTSMIMAYERMGIYAYISIFEAISKLFIVYLLSVTNSDRLIFYAILMSLLQVVTALFYYYYCNHYLAGSKLGSIFNRSIFKSLMGFSGWNVIANLAETLKMQGYVVLLNLFFQPFVVAAQTIGNQVAGAMMQFINNFRTAINPQIIKLYASGDYEESKRLTMSTTVLVYDMVLLLGLPAIFVMNTIMNIWLVEVPPYAVLFTQFIIVQRILSTFDSAFYIPMMAAAKIKTNSILASFSGPGVFAMLYVIYKFGGDVMWMQYLGIFVMFVFGFAIKPYLLVHDVEGYSYKDFIPCFFSCAKVTILSVLLSYGAYAFLGNDELFSSIWLCLISILSVCLSSYIFLDHSTRYMVNGYVKRYIFRFSK